MTTSKEKGMLAQRLSLPMSSLIQYAQAHPPKLQTLPSVLRTAKVLDDAVESCAVTNEINKLALKYIVLQNTRSNQSNLL